MCGPPKRIVPSFFVSKPTCRLSLHGKFCACHTKSEKKETLKGKENTIQRSSSCKQESRDINGFASSSQARRQHPGKLRVQFVPRVCSVSVGPETPKAICNLHDSTDFPQERSSHTANSASRIQIHHVETTSRKLRPWFSLPSRDRFSIRYSRYLTLTRIWSKQIRIPSTMKLTARASTRHVLETSLGVSFLHCWSLSPISLFRLNPTSKDPRLRRGLPFALPRDQER